MTEGIEKRRHLRLSAMGPVEIVAQGGSAETAYLASIGRGGLGLYLRQEVKRGQLILANLHLIAKEGNAEDHKVVARVRWSRAVPPLWMAGFAFEQMSFWKLVNRYPKVERARGYLICLGLEGEGDEPGETDVE